MDSTAIDNLQPPRFQTGKPLLIAGLGERITPENGGAGIPGRIKTNPDGTIDAPSTDEAFMREHFKEWKRLMKARPNMQVKREV